MSSKSHSLRALRTCLNLEELEPRWVPSAGYQPTAQEQLMLEQLNDARANPAAYGASIGLDLSNVAPAQPLAFSPQLIQAAQDHSQDMNDRNYFGHTTPDGVTPWQRISATGFSYTSAGESIEAGSSTTAGALQDLIVDSGTPNLGHRMQLLAIDPTYQGQNQVGIGIVQNGAGQWSNYYTIDTAQGTDSRPFITGVVYNDLNGNGKYDIGEGLGGVTLTVAGVGQITTWDSGGYSAQVNPGTYTVTASGGGLAAPITETVTVGSQNSRLNFVETPGAPPPQNNTPAPTTTSTGSSAGSSAGSGTAAGLGSPTSFHIHHGLNASDVLQLKEHLLQLARAAFVNSIGAGTGAAGAGTSNHDSTQSTNWGSAVSLVQRIQSNVITAFQSYGASWGLDQWTPAQLDAYFSYSPFIFPF